MSPEVQGFSKNDLPFYQIEISHAQENKNLALKRNALDCKVSVAALSVLTLVALASAAYLVFSSGVITHAAAIDPTLLYSAAAIGGSGVILAIWAIFILGGHPSRKKHIEKEHPDRGTDKIAFDTLIDKMEHSQDQDQLCQVLDLVMQKGVYQEFLNKIGEKEKLSEPLLVALAKKPEHLKELDIKPGLAKEIFKRIDPKNEQAIEISKALIEVTKKEEEDLSQVFANYPKALAESYLTESHPYKTAAAFISMNTEQKLDFVEAIKTTENMDELLALELLAFIDYPSQSYPSDLMDKLFRAVKDSKSQDREALLCKHPTKVAEFAIKHEKYVELYSQMEANQKVLFLQELNSQVDALNFSPEKAAILLTHLPDFEDRKPDILIDRLFDIVASSALEEKLSILAKDPQRVVERLMGKEEKIASSAYEQMQDAEKISFLSALQEKNLTNLKLSEEFIHKLLPFLSDKQELFQNLLEQLSKNYGKTFLKHPTRFPRQFVTAIITNPNEKVSMADMDQAEKIALLKVFNERKNSDTEAIMNPYVTAVWQSLLTKEFLLGDKCPTEIGEVIGDWAEITAPILVKHLLDNNVIDPNNISPTIFSLISKLDQQNYLKFLSKGNPILFKAMVFEDLNLLFCSKNQHNSPLIQVFKSTGMTYTEFKEFILDNNQLGRSSTVRERYDFALDILELLEDKSPSLIVSLDSGEIGNARLKEFLKLLVLETNQEDYKPTESRKKMIEWFDQKEKVANIRNGIAFSLSELSKLDWKKFDGIVREVNNSKK